MGLGPISDMAADIFAVAEASVQSMSSHVASWSGWAWKEESVLDGGRGAAVETLEAAFLVDLES
jgi:hypothetical protein